MYTRILAYVKGDFPPGAHDFRAAFRVQRNMLKAHGAAYKIIHKIQEDARVGLAHNMRIFEPANPKRMLDRIVAWFQDFSFNQGTLKSCGGWVVAAANGYRSRICDPTHIGLDRFELLHQ